MAPLATAKLKSLILLLTTIIYIATSIPCNQSTNCGQCAYNTSCSWCVSDQQCYHSSTISNQCTNPTSDNIITSTDIYQCCTTSTACQQCASLWYVECDWCDTNKECFKSSELPSACNNWNNVIYKDGTCPKDHQSFPQQILSFIQKPLVILISIFIGSYIIVSIIIFFIIHICEKYKCCQPLTVILLCFQLLLLLPGLYIIYCIPYHI